MFVYLCKSAKMLAKLKPLVTIEAEYGKETVDGEYLTLAHHGDNAKFLCPAESFVYTEAAAGINNGNSDYETVIIAENVRKAEDPGKLIGNKAMTIGVSHFDLDTMLGLYGLACFAGIQTGLPVPPKEFLKLAAFADINGWHKVYNAGLDAQIESVAAFNAWAQQNLRLSPNAGTDAPFDAGSYALWGISILSDIFNGDAKLLEAGRNLLAAEDKLNRESYRAVQRLADNHGSVILRISDGFTNHLYRTPYGVEATAVIAYNSAWKSWTLSFADEPQIENLAAKVMTDLCGEGSGGRSNIAGSPRNKVMTADDLSLDQAVNSINKYLTADQRQR